MPKKVLFCLGVPRSATTWTHRQLKGHPEICAVPRKEIHYIRSMYGSVDRLSDLARQRAFKSFVDSALELRPDPGDRHLSQLDNWRPGGVSSERFSAFHRDLDWYLRFLQGPVCSTWYERLFARVEDHQWALDFSTTNGMVSDEGFAAMAAFAEQTCGLLVLRHPLDRLWSHIKLHASIICPGNEVDTWDRLQVNKFVDENNLLEASLYSQLVEKTKRHFPKSCRAILSYDTLVEDPVGFLSDIFSLIGVAAPDNLAQRAARRSVGHLTRRRHEALQDFIPVCLSDLKNVRMQGIPFVTPWIQDLKELQAHQDDQNSFMATPLLIPHSPITPDEDHRPKDTQIGT